MKAYIGCKKVLAEPETGKSGEPGYAVVYPDNYRSWSPKEVFEAAYMPLNGFATADDNLRNESCVTQQMVDDFILKLETKTIGAKTTVLHATLINGFEIIESSSCVDPANYHESIGHNICLERVKNQIWHLLGFALQWANSGVK